MSPDCLFVWGDCCSGSVEFKIKKKKKKNVRCLILYYYIQVTLCGLNYPNIRTSGYFCFFFFPLITNTFIWAVLLALQIISLFSLVFSFRCREQRWLWQLLSVEKKKWVTFLIHNATSCGCTALWSIFWYCQRRDWYLVLFYDGFLPVWLLMQNGESVMQLFDSDVLTLDPDVYHMYFRLLDIYLLPYNTVEILWCDKMSFCIHLAIHIHSDRKYNTWIITLRVRWVSRGRDMLYGQNSNINCSERVHRSV